MVGNALGEQAIAGIEKHLSDFLIFYAPTVNSYKRLRYLICLFKNMIKNILFYYIFIKFFEQFREQEILSNWNKLGFMQENCGLNIIQENGEKKLFFTLPGADVNPYLCAFSLLASVIFFLCLKFIKIKFFLNNFCR